MKKYENIKKILLMVVCLILSVIIWLYVVGVENPIDDTDVRNISINIINEDVLADRGLIITSGADSTVSLHLEGTRNDLILLSNSENISISMDVSDITEPGQYTHVYDVSLPVSNIEIKDRTPYYVNLTVDKLVSKPVDVTVKLVGNVAEGYIADEPFSNPASINVQGPEEIVAKVSYALATLTRENVQATITDAPVSYVFIDQDGNEINSDLLTMDYDTVKVTLNVKTLKEIPLSINIVDGGGATAENNVNYTISPSSISVAGEPDVLKSLNQISLGNIDLANVINSTNQTFQILLPNDVTNISGVSSAQVSLEIIGLSSKTIGINNIQIINKPDGYDATQITTELSVIVRGPEQTLDIITASNIRAVVDLTDLDLVTGQHNVTASVFIDGYSDVGVVGEYKVALTIEPATS